MELEASACSEAASSSVNRKDEEGWAPIHLVARSCNAQTIEILLNHGRARLRCMHAILLLGLSHLKIVTMVLHEVLQLYTPLTAMHGTTYKPMELGGVTYPAGVVLMLPLLCVSTMARRCGAPTPTISGQRGSNKGSPWRLPTRRILSVQLRARGPATARASRCSRPRWGSP